MNKPNLCKEKNIGSIQQIERQFEDYNFDVFIKKYY